MPVTFGYKELAALPQEHINDKISRRVLSGKQGMMVWWTIKVGAHAAAHKHPHEQIVWMLKGRMDFRIGDEKRSMVAGDVAVIPSGVEHEGFSPRTQK
jgi:quercetin dioxygenase-like cupin family protein